MDGAVKSTGSMIHPAVRYVERSEKLWTDDSARANLRAHLIVCALIDANFITGTVRSGTAFQLDETEQ